MLQANSLAAVLKGGEDGKVVTPGESAKSALVVSAAQIDDETAMPPKKNGGPGKGPTPPAGPDGKPAQPRGGPPAKPLTADQVGILRAWIDQGAK